MKVDTEPRIVRKSRYASNRGWCHKTRDHTDGPKHRVDGFYRVPGVGIVHANCIISYEVSTSCRVFVQIAYGRYSAFAEAHGSQDDGMGDLIVMAARAALAEAKRTNRKRRKSKKPIH